MLINHYYYDYCSYYYYYCSYYHYYYYYYYYNFYYYYYFNEILNISYDLFVYRTVAIIVYL